MKKRKIYLAVIFILIACIFMYASQRQGPIEEFTEDIDEKAKVNYLKGSDPYFIGKWDLIYLDIVHYETSENFKEPSSYTFKQEGNNLILEEQFPVIESDFKDKSFHLQINMNAVILSINGIIVDNNNWEAEFEYTDEYGKVLSKSKVKAART